MSQQQFNNTGNSTTASNFFASVIAAAGTPFVVSAVGNNVTYSIQLAGSANASDADFAGIASFSDADFTVDANGFVSLLNSPLDLTITADTGGPFGPTANNWNILGQGAGSIPVTETNGAASTYKVEHKAWITPYVVDASTTVGLRGTYSTIQAAITAAPANGIIAIRAGTYTENLTLKSGQALVSLEGTQFGASGNVNIVGKLSDGSGAAAVSFTGIAFTTNGDYAADLTAGSSLNFNNCTVGGNNTLFRINNATANLYLNNTDTNLGTTGIALVDLINGTLWGDTCQLGNTGGSTTPANVASGSIRLRNCTCTCLISTSSAGELEITDTQFGSRSTPFTNVTYVTTAGTGTSKLSNCQIYSGTATAIVVGSGTVVEAYGTDINSTNAAVVSGAGTFKHDGVTFSNTGTVISATTETLAPKASMYFAKGQVVNYTAPGAYPYTVLTTDYVVGVDTSSARTINLPASPRTGQTFRIKDITGSANANNITITPAAGNIDGAATFVINIDRGSVDITYSGTEWVVL